LIEKKELTFVLVLSFLLWYNYRKREDDVIMSIEELSILQAKENYRLIEGHLKSVQIASITYSDPYAGSQLYVLQDAENQTLYVGETGKSLYARIKGNGNSSHCKKPWFTDVDTVLFIELPDNKFIRRKWENEVSIVLEPLHN